jgi:hypothetical protein
MTVEGGGLFRQIVALKPTGLSLDTRLASADNVLSNCVSSP